MIGRLNHVAIAVPDLGSFLHSVLFNIGRQSWQAPT